MKTNYQIILKVLGEGGIRYWHPKEIEVIERVLTFQRKEILKMIEQIRVVNCQSNYDICYNRGLKKLKKQIEGKGK